MPDLKYKNEQLNQYTLDMSISDRPWKEKGMLVKFDQDELVDITINNHTDKKDLVHLMK